MHPNSRIHRLGRSIRDGAMTAEDLVLLSELRRTWASAMDIVFSGLIEEFEGSPVEITARVKNLQTLGEKLRRLSGGLSTVRDVVGCRVVLDGTRSEQVAAVGRVIARFSEPQPRVISRIADPRAGYRAVHVEIRVANVRVEVQVRTRGQHEWAEAMEEFGDIVGRGVRYDEVQFAHLDPVVASRAHACLVALRTWSDALDLWERNGSPPLGRSRDALTEAIVDWKSHKEALDASL